MNSIFQDNTYLYFRIHSLNLIFTNGFTWFVILTIAFLIFGLYFLICDLYDKNNISSKLKSIIKNHKIKNTRVKIYFEGNFTYFLKNDSNNDISNFTYDSNIAFISNTDKITPIKASIYIGETKLKNVKQYINNSIGDLLI